MDYMDRFNGNAARQLPLMPLESPDNADGPDRDDPIQAPRRPQAGPSLRLLRKDVYAELQRRRRRAQIAARHLLDRAEAEQE